MVQSPWGRESFSGEPLSTWRKPLAEKDSRPPPPPTPVDTGTARHEEDSRSARVGGVLGGRHGRCRRRSGRGGRQEAPARADRGHLQRQLGQRRPEGHGGRDPQGGRRAGAVAGDQRRVGSLPAPQPRASTATSCSTATAAAMGPSAGDPVEAAGGQPEVPAAPARPVRCVAGRGAMERRTVQFANVHLQPILLRENDNLAGAYRAFSQMEATHAREIEDVYKGLAPKVPTLVAGDLNSMSPSAAHAVPLGQGTPRQLRLGDQGAGQPPHVALADEAAEAQRAHRLPVPHARPAHGPQPGGAQRGVGPPPAGEPAGVGALTAMDDHAKCEARGWPDSWVDNRAAAR